MLGEELSIESEKTGTENGETGIEKSEAEILVGLSDTEKKVVELILADSKITQERTADNMKMSKNGIRYVMGKLREKGILRREGATKKGRWIINLNR